MKLRRRPRRALLVVHVTASASWLGVTLGLLTLAVTATATGAGPAVEASARAMKLFADWLVIPVALLTLVSGLLLSLGTPWGLARHRWVYIKFWLTLVTTAASVFALRPGVDDAVVTLSAGEALTRPTDLLAGPIVSLTSYVFMTAISVLKPWGLTRRGRKHRASARKAVDATGLRPTA
ncbi:DUF2269 domain-containing protein [Streptomyces sp. NPDC006552]|uniref:DUF2269 domain-containing protein n=1 Tax=Streptomyces sp. NPDC006552 TaxID=3157179 RepID=UPI0033AA71A7